MWLEQLLIQFKEIKNDKRRCRCIERKSTVCILKPYGEVVSSPFEIHHVEKDMEDLDNLLSKLDGEVRIVMEATGIYHLPVVTFLHDKGYFVSIVNPFAMKKYAKDNSIRGAKTDRLDSIMIANYGIEKWFKLQRYEGTEETYAELKLLGRRYRYYMELHVKALQELNSCSGLCAAGNKEVCLTVGMKLMEKINSATL